MYEKPQTEEDLQRITTEAMHTPTNTAIALLDAWLVTVRRCWRRSTSPHS